MKRYLFLGYGIVAYLVFFATILYAIGFTGNLVVSKSIDGIPKVSFTEAITTNSALLLLFALQHSIMPRSSLKNRWAKLVPAPLERSTFVLMASGSLVLLMLLWQPMDGTIWAVTSLAGKGFMQFFFFLGWGLALISTFLINHFDLFGIKAVWLHFNGKSYTPVALRTKMFYQLIRHPLYLGFILAFWCTPVMTASHLLFAIVLTGYILTAIQFEENYLAEVIPMIFPFIKKKIS